MATVKVRIAVAVCPKGKWMAAGGSEATDLMAMGSCLDFVEPGEARYFIEANLDIPEVKTVQGTVMKGPRV